MSLSDELLENDEEIIKSFKTKPTLCPEIFKMDGGNYLMVGEVRKKLLEISNDFTDSLGVEFFIHDVVLTGSLSNFNWSEYSDVDLHILIDMDEISNDNETISTALHTIMKEFFDSKRNVWNEKHDVKVMGYDVEVYVQDLNEEHVSSGVYSILHDKWIVIPKKINPKIDDRKIIEKSHEFSKKIEELMGMDDLKEVIKKIEELRKKLKKFRQSGLAIGGEYSYENLTFKLLGRNGEIEKLLNLKNSLIDKNLSIEQ